MKISPIKAEHLSVNENDSSGTVRSLGAERKKVKDVKCFGSTVQSEREFGKEVKRGMSKQVGTGRFQV